MVLFFTKDIDILFPAAFDFEIYVMTISLNHKQCEQRAQIPGAFSFLNQQNRGLSLAVVEALICEKRHESNTVAKKKQKSNVLE